MNAWTPRSSSLPAPPASGKSALGRGPRRAVRRHDHQCRQHTGLSRPRGADGAARAAVPWRGMPHRLYGVIDAGRSLLGRALARARAGGDRGGARRRAAADPGRRHRALSRARCSRALRRCRRWRRAAARRGAARSMRDLGGEAFRAALAELDPETAARLRRGDTQRLIRAYEVVRATGRGARRLAARAADPARGPARAAIVLLAAARGALCALRPALPRHDGSRRARRGAALLARGLARLCPR